MNKSTPATTKRVSAIDGMSINDVRASMDAVRSAYQDGTLRMGQRVRVGMTAVEFCARLALGRHMKRR